MNWTRRRLLAQAAPRAARPRHGRKFLTLCLAIPGPETLRVLGVVSRECKSSVGVRLLSVN